MDYDIAICISTQVFVAWLENFNVQNLNSDRSFASERMADSIDSPHATTHLRRNSTTTNYYGEELDPEDKILDDYREILDEARKVKLDNENEDKNFEARFGAVLSSKHSTRGTLLHQMADQPLGEDRASLLRWILRRRPSILNEKDGDMKGALHIALSRKKWGFVNIVLEYCPNETLAESLQLSDRVGDNCLHEAITREFPNINELIAKSSSKILESQNREKNTPLHLAMELAVRPENRPPEKPDQNTLSSALPAPLLVPQKPIIDPSSITEGELRNNSKGEEEASKGKEGPATKKEPPVKNEAPRVKNKEPPLKNKEPLGKNEEPPAKYKDHPNKSKEPPMKNEEPPPADLKLTRTNTIPPNVQEPNKRSVSFLTATEISKFKRRIVFWLPEVVQGLLKRGRNAMSIENGNGETPYQCRLRFLKENPTKIWFPKAQKADKSRGLGEKGIEEDGIAREVKNYCLRNSERDDAIKILYKQGQERHIEFDLSGLPSLSGGGPSISDAFLTWLEIHLKFEETLQYVALPKLRVEHLGRSQRTQPEPSQSGSGSKPNPGGQPDRLGLTDLQFIFDWLAKRGVNTIIKVIVVDDGDVSHSDESIEDSLKDFGVEVWDWKKLDICSETIFKAAKDARIVYLYSTGNNAVLRSWCSEEGLVKLKKLERIHVHVRPGLETPTRRGLDVGYFKTTLLRNWSKLYEGESRPPVIEIVEDDKPKSYASGFQSNQAAEQKKQLWLKHMDNFADFIAGVEDDVGGDIKVAVIDDGIDGFQEDFAENLVSGVSFCRYSDSDNLMNAYYVPSGNHGTIMASLICRVCPKAKLFVARLEEYKAPSNRRQITARSATEAVLWAIKKGVHIISMSWTIESSPDAPDIQDFENAIHLAHQSKIIMVCAFSDQGSVSGDNCFPRGYPLKIGAATALGGTCTWVEKDKVEFLFPGEHIVVDRKMRKSSRPESGSSIATALAAGFAALLLYIARLEQKQHPDDDRDLFEELRKKGKMKDVFKKLGPDKYIHVEDYFPLTWNNEIHWETSAGRQELGRLVAKLI